ncbi:SMI1/KNR4 family protein [Streptomyces sp. NPDC056821]|uniref:SMI1/KNR4 family protein n=1 Tax=unclassified Streptomyces TaxID=2593676 RepID=UPI0036A7C2E7
MEQDWQELGMNSGLNLPVDYKQFVTAYGPGRVNGQLYLFHPRAAVAGEGLHLESLWEQASSAYFELSQNAPEMYPFRVYPEPGGCVPIARSISGNHVFLAPPGTGGSDWSVVVDMGEWIQLPMSFTEFLWAALNGDLDVPVIEGEPMFEPIGTMQS